MRKKNFLITGVALLLLTGCTGEPNSAPAETSPTEETATQEQVASVIAGEEFTFRDASDDFFDCRYSYTIDAEGIEALTCTTRQKTVVVTAQIVAKDLRELSPPESMEPLVEETLAKLDLIGGVDMDACGDAPTLDDESCSTELTALDVYLDSLTGTLDSWGPYL